VRPRECDEKRSCLRSREWTADGRFFSVDEAARDLRDRNVRPYVWQCRDWLFSRSARLSWWCRDAHDSSCKSVRGHVLELFVAGAVTLAAAPLARRWAFSRGVLDIPNHRSSHDTPTPRTGGLACIAGVIVAVAVSTARNHHLSWLMLAGVAALACVGYLDDQRGLPAKSRLGVQLVAGAAIGAGTMGGAWIWVVVGVVVVPIAVNVVNFMDGVNGITGLTMVCWGVTALLAGRAAELTPLTAIGGLITGSALGFLPWNIPVARLFLGDAGSYIFGALVASGVIFGWANGVSAGLLIAPLSIYLLDTFVVLLKPIHRGSPLFEAHREHEGYSAGRVEM